MGKDTTIDTYHSDERGALFVRAMTRIKVFGISFFLLVFSMTSFAQCGEYLDSKYIADSCFRAKNYMLASTYYEKCVTLKARKRVDYYYAAYCFLKLNWVDKALKMLEMGANSGLYYNTMEDFANDTLFQKMYKDNRKWAQVGNRIKKNTNSHLKKIKIDSMLVKNLMRRKLEDQRYRGLATSSMSLSAKDSLWKFQKKIDIDNQQWLAEEINKNGWPGIYKTGETGDNMAWLIVQHADNDTVFQEKCLEVLKLALLDNNTNIHNIAYLEDRIRVNTNRKQLYGTQFENVLRDGKTIDLILKPTEDPACLNKRRAYMDLAPVEEYLNESRKRYVNQ